MSREIEFTGAKNWPDLAEGDEIMVNGARSYISHVERTVTDGIASYVFEVSLLPPDVSAAKPLYEFDSGVGEQP